MALRAWLLWGALPAAGASQVAALAECDATALVQSLSEVGKLKELQARDLPGAPPVTPSNYWMFNYGRNRPRSAVEKTISLMSNYTSAAADYPAFSLPAESGEGASTKKMMAELNGAFTALKRNLTRHQKSLSHALFNIHVNLPLALQEKDTPFQDQWKTALHDVINSVQHHRDFLASLGASSQVCLKTADFLEDLDRKGEAYSRFLGEAASTLPPPLPAGNGFINATALEARRDMYNASRAMMLRLARQVRSSMMEYLNRTAGCGEPPPTEFRPLQAEPRVEEPIRTAQPFHLQEQPGGPQQLAQQQQQQQQTEQQHVQTEQQQEQQHLQLQRTEPRQTELQQQQSSASARIWRAGALTALLTGLAGLC
mmetsp:Transcript_66604/g.206201  ORF Transcript_66604/g.206201 Transcript_66604/m.206201 type:complete len:370 (-) Transcript_66604:6-1115(-)